MSDPSSELLLYNANCHCGAVTFTIRIPSLSHHEVASCNCSICTRNGYLLVYPNRKDVQFHTGYDHLVSYRFGDKMGAHMFCPTCSSSVMCDFEGYDWLAINVRLIQDIDPKVLKLKLVDGRAMKPDYEVAKSTSSGPGIAVTIPVSSGLTSYPANCHCGSVIYTVRIPSLAQHEVNICNCSICTHNGYLLVYPEREYVVFHQGYEHLRTYLFGNKKKSHKFCPTCGSSILIDFNRSIEPDELAVNARMIQDIDPKEFKYTYFDGGKQMGPEYIVGRQGK